MTVSVSLFALLPILWSSGVGSDVMKPIVLPMIGGVLTSCYPYFTGNTLDIFNDQGI